MTEENEIISQLDPEADVNTNLQTFFKIYLTEQRKITKGMDDIFKNQKTLGDALLEIRSEQEQIVMRHNDLGLKLIDMEEKISRREQRFLTENLIIRNVPVHEKRQADVLVMAKAIVKAINADSEQSVEIAEAFRLGKTDGGKCPPILVKLKEASKRRDSIIKARKMKLNCSHVLVNGKTLGAPSVNLYLEEQLTSYTSSLFAEARKLKRAGRIKSAWIINGNLFVRKEEKGAQEKITREDQLVKYGLTIPGADKMDVDIRGADKRPRLDDSVDHNTPRKKAALSLGLGLEPLFK